MCNACARFMVALPGLDFFAQPREGTRVGVETPHILQVIFRKKVLIAAKIRVSQAAHYPHSRGKLYRVAAYLYAVYS